MIRRKTRITQRCLEDDITQVEIPNSIDVVFEEDYDITYIDDIIRKKLILERILRLPELKKELIIMSSLYEDIITISEKQKIRKNIDYLTNEINHIESGGRWRNYTSNVNSLIKSYREDFVHGKYRKALGTIDEIVIDDSNDDLIDLIYSYIRIASQYITLNVSRIYVSRAVRCYNCAYPLDQYQCNTFLRVVCVRCNAEQTSSTLMKTSKDVKSSSKKPKDDETLDNFLKTFNQKLGKENVILPYDLFDKLDEYYSSHGCPIGEEVRQMPLNSDNKRGNSNHEVLHDALKAIGEPDFYKNMDYIGSLYFGWKLYDFEYLRPIIIMDYLETQKVYLSLDETFRNRQSSLGTQYRLRKHLQLRGFMLPQSEFKIAKNIGSRHNHERVWKIMITNTGNPDHHFIPD